MKKKYRIKRNEEFTEIISKKHCVFSKRYTIFFDTKKEEYSRVGISVSKKLGIAPVRNKIKRQLRMMFIENYQYDIEKYDLIVIVKKEFVESTYKDNLVDLEKTLKKAII